MIDNIYKINDSDTKQVVECMKNITIALQENKERSESMDICTMDIAEMFGWTHTKVFNLISRYITVKATEAEKNEFKFKERIYRQGVRKHAVCYLTKKGCEIFIDKICASESRKSKQFIEGAKKLKRAIVQENTEQRSILMDGRSRTECQKIKELFDRFITGPALENREIAELTEKYQMFHDIMKKTQIKVKESNKIEGAVYEVAIEAEMQGFIYGFKLYEELLNRQLAIV